MSQFLMTEKTEASESSVLTDNRLRLVYIAGITLNMFALLSAVRAGEPLIAVTFVFVLVYLCFRYWTTLTS
jgi:hypothetical protein